MGDSPECGQRFFSSQSKVVLETAMDYKNNNGGTGASYDAAVIVQRGGGDKHGLK